MRAVLALLALLSASPALATGMPDALAAQVAALGRVIDPPGTARLYAPLHGAEPWAGLRVTRDARYGEDPRHRLDVFAPAERGPARPVLVFMHGGAYVAGDKQTPNSPFNGHIGAWAARNGFVGVTITYRLAPAHPWPAAQQDIGAALRWVAGHIVEHGGDPGRIILMGQSAGAAHVATYLAHPELQAAPVPALRAAVLLSGRYDLTRGEASQTTRAYYGSDPARYAERSSFQGVVRSRLPLFLSWAELDPPEFIAEGEALRGALCAAGHCPAGLALARHSHMSEVYAIGTADTTLTAPLLAFLRRF